MRIGNGGRSQRLIMTTYQNKMWCYGPAWQNAFDKSIDIYAKVVESAICQKCVTEMFYCLHEIFFTYDDCVIRTTAPGQ